MSGNNLKSTVHKDMLKNNHPNSKSIHLDHISFDGTVLETLLSYPPSREMNIPKKYLFGTPPFKFSFPHRSDFYQIRLISI